MTEPNQNPNQETKAEEPVTPAEAADKAPDTTELQEKLEAAERERDAAVKAKLSAEEAITREKSEHSRTKRELKEKETATLTEAEKLQKDREEALAEKNEYAAKRNAVDAEKLFVAAGIPETSYNALLEDIVSPDPDKTIAIAKGIAAMVESERTTAREAEREKVLAEMPKPPSGESEEVVDEFIAGLKEG